MDTVEEEFMFATEEFIEDTCTNQLKEVDFLMKRMKFENDQLDSLEEKNRGTRKQNLPNAHRACQKTKKIKNTTLLNLQKENGRMARSLTAKRD